jgi:hypothetical protein
VIDRLVDDDERQLRYFPARTHNTAQNNQLTARGTFRP